MIVYINNRDLLTWPRNTARVLRGQGHTPIIIDNASTYPPLLAWYEREEPGILVHRLEENLGHKALFLAPGLLPTEEPFVLTDPDLDISMLPDDWPEVLQRGLDCFPVKCGLSLDDTAVPTASSSFIPDDFYAAAGSLPPWRYPLVTARSERLDVTYYNFPLDTTFALYRPGTSEHRVEGSRAGRPYCVRHLPWHIVLDRDHKEPTLQIVMNDELYYYFTHANDSSTTAQRSAKMIAEYGKRRTT